MTTARTEAPEAAPATRPRGPQGVLAGPGRTYDDVIDDLHATRALLDELTVTMNQEVMRYRLEVQAFNVYRAPVAPGESRRSKWEGYVEDMQRPPAWASGMPHYELTCPEHVQERKIISAYLAETGYGPPRAPRVPNPLVAKRHAALHYRIAMLEYELCLYRKGDSVRPKREPGDFDYPDPRSPHPPFDFSGGVDATRAARGRAE